MSLVVCSNGDPSNSYDRYALDQAPYRFRNHLVNPVDLPPNSEVAVINVKVNKNGLIKISQSDRFYQYFNINPRNNADTPLIDNTAKSTGMPVLCSPETIGNEDFEYVNINDFALRLQDGIRAGAIIHPDMDKSKILVDIVRSSGVAGSGFAGFRLTYEYFGEADTNTMTTDWNKLTDAYSQPSTMTLSQNGSGNTVITCNADRNQDPLNHNVVWANEHPLSKQNGVWDIDITGLQTGGMGADATNFSSDWACGLARGTKASRGGLSYLNGGRDGVSANGHFYDYVVYCEQNAGGGNRWLKVAHCVYDDDDTERDPANPMRMDEIVYWNDGTGNYNGGNWTTYDAVGGTGFITVSETLTGRYNMSANHEKWDTLRFLQRGEQMAIMVKSTVGGGRVGTVDTWYEVAGFTMPNVTKLNIPKPIAQTCLNLYPKVMIRTAGRSLSFTNFYGRNTGYKLGDERADWFCRMMVNAMPVYPIQIDSGEYNQINTGTEIYTQKGITGTGATQTLTDYEMQVILGNATPTYAGTEDANMQHRLGFVSRAVLDANAGTVTNNKVVYDSDAVPNLVDYSSQFVRLDNFTQKSYNAGQQRGGRPSKILYHMPRFDQSNREIGTALYFSPNYPVYCKLNNSDPIKLNEIQMSICDKNERLIEDLTGDTVISLHFKQSTTPIEKLRYN